MKHEAVCGLASVIFAQATRCLALWPQTWKLIASSLKPIICFACTGVVKNCALMGKDSLSSSQFMVRASH